MKGIVSTIILFLFVLSDFQLFANVNSECKTALTNLFSKNISQSEAADFLKVQGDLTLHRMAWAYLKAQKNDQKNNKGEKLESIERTILSLLDEKYTSTDPDFKKARDLFETQPLSRESLAEIGPYLKDFLVEKFDAKYAPFLLNASDLKMLNALAKFEKKSSVNGVYDSRLLAHRSPQGILNFTKLINSSYKTSKNITEDALNIEMKLQGLEQTIGMCQNRINSFIKKLAMPNQCKNVEKNNGFNRCAKGHTNISELFTLNEQVQNIFWDSLSDKLVGDDILLDNLTYNKIWLRSGNDSSRPLKIDQKKQYTTTIIGRKSKITKTSPIKDFYAYQNIDLKVMNLG